MIGRKVTTRGYGQYDIAGTVIEWAPLGAAMCDALIQRDDGSICWVASHTLVPIDDLGPLPSRRAAQKQARAETGAGLHEIRRQLISKWHDPWPGCEHGKALVGRMIDRALARAIGHER